MPPLGDASPMDLYGLSEWEELDPVSHVLGLASLGDELEISDARTDRDPELVSVDDAREVDRLPLSPRGLPKEVVVTGEEDAVQFGRPIQQLRIRVLGGAVFERRNHVDPGA